VQSATIAPPAPCNAALRVYVVIDPTASACPRDLPRPEALYQRERRKRGSDEARSGDPLHVKKH
jgi:hypothetical protein